MVDVDIGEDSDRACLVKEGDNPVLVEREWALDTDADECDEIERVDAGGEVGSGISCSGGKSGVVDCCETERLMEGRRDARVVARERCGRLTLGRIEDKEEDDGDGDGGERIVDRDNAGFARPDTLDLMRKEPEPDSRFTEGVESLFKTLLVSLRGRGVVGGIGEELDGSTGSDET